jgi:hypothetical protein
MTRGVGETTSVAVSGHQEPRTQAQAEGEHAAVGRVVTILQRGRRLD